MQRYEPPVLIASFSIEELREEAATCAMNYQFSDRALKIEVERIDSPLVRLARIRTSASPAGFSPSSVRTTEGAPSALTARPFRRGEC
jgi:hypothetical protein